MWKKLIRTPMLHEVLISSCSQTLQSQPSWLPFNRAYCQWGQFHCHHPFPSTFCTEQSFQPASTSLKTQHFLTSNWTAFESWSTKLSLYLYFCLVNYKYVCRIFWRRKWQPAPWFLPGKSHGQRSMVGYSPWGQKRVSHDLATKQQQGIVSITALCTLQPLNWGNSKLKTI